jgi:hypothetical protein
VEEKLQPAEYIGKIVFSGLLGGCNYGSGGRAGISGLKPVHESCQSLGERIRRILIRRFPGSFNELLGGAMQKLRADLFCNVIKAMATPEKAGGIIFLLQVPDQMREEDIQQVRSQIVRQDSRSQIKTPKF